MRVIVVGAGVVGLSAACRLVELGHEAVLLDRGAIPNPEASSHDRHRLIRRAHRAGDGRNRTIDEAYAAWEALWVRLGARHYRKLGMLMTAREPGDWAFEARADFEELRVPYEVWDRSELERRCPFLRLTPEDWGLYNRQGGALLAERIVHDLARLAADLGVELRPHAEVLAVEPERRAVRLADGSRAVGDSVALASGAWTGRLVPELAPRLEPRRSLVAYLEPPPDLAPSWAGSPCILDLGGVSDGYLVPPMEGWGVKWGSGTHSRPGDPAAPRELRPGEPADLLEYLRPHLRDLDRYRVAEARVCYTNYTADERFLAGALDEGVVYATGCSGQMFKFGAAMGRRLADAAVGGLSGEGLAAWARADAAVPLDLAA